MLIPIILVFLVVVILVQEHRLSKARKEAQDWRVACERFESWAYGQMRPQNPRGGIAEYHRIAEVMQSLGVKDDMDLDDLAKAMLPQR